MRLFLLLFLSFIQFTSAGENPHERIHEVIESQLELTSLGQRLSTQVQEKSPLFLFNCLTDDSKRLPICKKSYHVNGNEIQINGHFQDSTDEYLSWIIFQALIEYKMLYIDSFEVLPTTVELKRYVLNQSIKYTQSLFSTCEKKIDFYAHPENDFARVVDMSLCEFFNLSASQQLLDDRIDLRTRTLLEIEVTVQHILESNSFSKEQKQKALELLKI